MYRLRWVGVVFGLLLAAGAHAQTQLETDEATLKAGKLPTDAKGLLEYFVHQSPKEGDAKELDALIKKLGSDVYREREPAKKALIKRGPVALPFLRGVLANNPPLETKRLALLCVQEIEATMKSESIGAAARVLLASKEPKAAEVLFNFLPLINADPFLEEELLTCVGRLTIAPDKVDPLLINALKDPLSFRRHVAAYLVGRRGSTEHRQQLRDMLADPDADVRLRVADGLFGKRPAQVLADALLGDETLLRAEKIDFNEAGLLKFISNRTPSQADQKQYRTLVQALGSSNYYIREPARKKLLGEGIKALGFLREAEADSNLERKRRAEALLNDLRGNNNTAIPIAAAHLLARPAKKDQSPGAIIRTLLAFIPFVEDENVEEEVLTCLTLLSLREPKVEPELLKALTDASPARRAAAAYVLGHVGTKEQVAKVQPLLDDLHPVVRLRAAQGMLAARNKIALPAFVKLLTSVPAPYLGRVEEVLYRVAEDKGPTETIALDSRDKAAKAWGKWLEANQAKIDLTSLNDRETYLGLITVAEYDNAQNQPQGSQVWEATRGGPKRFTFTAGLNGAMDAHTLPNGRILVAENSAMRITERDTKGAIKWEYQIPNQPGIQGNPVVCQRLPNGNTFIATYNSLMEITPAKTQVYRITPGQQFIFGAHRARNGHVVAITQQGTITEYETPSGKQVNTVQAQSIGNWCSVELLSNGNYLVASMQPGNGSVRELNRTGGEVWSKPFPGAFRATRLPNGNVLVSSMQPGPKQVAEMDRNGTIRWSVPTQGRPWCVHYR